MQQQQKSQIWDIQHSDIDTIYNTNDIQEKTVIIEFYLPD